jgi:VWFA-related protein
MSSAFRLIAPIVASAVVLQAQLPSSSQTTFRAGVEVVDVDVSVLDKHRLPVRGLSAADFAVLEDGRARPIVAFTPVDLPTRETPTAPWLVEVAPDVQTNEFPREGRLIVILMDRSVGMDTLPVARRIAEAAIDQLRPGDLAAVTYSTFGMPQNFTDDRRRLLAAIRQPLLGLPADDSGDVGDCYCGLCTLEAITTIAEGVQDVRQRRKMLFYIGANIPIQSTNACGGLISQQRDRLLRAASAGNLTVYSFDPTGIPTLMPSAASRNSSAASISRAAAANLTRVGNLMVLPERTGGRAVFGNEPARSLPEVFRESNSYYVLGFNPAHSDGRFHRIEVKVAGKDLSLQARRGYYAPGGAPRAPTKAPPDMSPLLHSAIAGLWPRTDLPLSINVAPVALPGMRSAGVPVVLGFEQSPPHDATLDVLVGAYDRNGRTLASSRQAVQITPRRKDSASFKYELVSRLELKPGRYEIRAAVEDPNLQQAGSVHTYLDVPDFFKELVSMSGIFLHDEGVPPVGAPVTDLLPLTPTSRRQFSRTDRVTAFLQIYQGVTRPAMPGYITAYVRDDFDTRVFSQETRVLASDVGANRAINFTLDLPLASLTPGSYLLTVDVRQGNAAAKKDLRFTVQ